MHRHTCTCAHTHTHTHTHTRMLATQNNATAMQTYVSLMHAPADCAIKFPCMPFIYMTMPAKQTHGTTDPPLSLQTVLSNFHIELDPSVASHKEVEDAQVRRVEDGGGGEGKGEGLPARFGVLAVFMSSVFMSLGCLQRCSFRSVWPAPPQTHARGRTSRRTCSTHAPPSPPCTRPHFPAHALNSP